MAASGAVLAQSTGGYGTSGTPSSTSKSQSDTRTTPQADPASKATPPRGDALAPGAGSSSAGVPAMGGVTPGRAEIASSAFNKLDAGNRGYVTLDDVRQLDGFEAPFRQADRNRDGRLDASEFNGAWSTYSRSAR